MLNITAEDILLDKSLKNFMPPEMPFMDHSILSIESYLPVQTGYGVISGVKLDQFIQSEDSMDEWKYFTPFATV